jgi:ABC-type transport system involved in multi-copper enzyme maturation permease subunit
MTAAAVEAVPRARFRDLLAAEWIKLWSLRSTSWTLAVVTLYVAGVSAYASLADYRNWPDYAAERRALFDPLRDAYPLAATLFLVLAAGSVGAVAVVGEYGTGLIRTTFAAVPARAAVAAAKIGVVAAVMTAAGAIAALAAFAVSSAILSGRHAALPFTDPVALRAFAASTLLVPLCALVGMAIGALVRHAATTVAALVGTLLLAPFLFNVDHRWSATIYYALPTPAYERLLVADPDPLGQLAFDGTVGGAWLAFAGWAVASVAVTVVMMSRRDP